MALDSERCWANVIYAEFCYNECKLMMVVAPG
jgi:hypothetical protein